MIKNVTVERALHRWEPWLNAVEEARTRLKDSDAETCWSYAGTALGALGLPAKWLLRLYFLSCVFSSYKHGDTYVFGEINLPLKQEWKAGFLYDSSVRQPDASSFRPLPPAIMTKKDAEHLLSYCRNFHILNKSSAEAFRKIYAPYLMMLRREHPLRYVASKVKRCVDSDRAIACAKMKESMTHRQIGEKFGWAIQKDAHGKRNCCSTSRRYVLLGRRLLSTSGPKE